MASASATIELPDAQYRGLRMSAVEFLDLPDDGITYELIDGVVSMSPSPTPRHQAVTTEIVAQIAWYLRDHPVGRVFAELDVHLGTGPGGGDLVYKPEAIFIRTERLAGMQDRVIGAPDLVLEVVSRGSRRFDLQTKKTDYERFGVREYWVIDPERSEILVYRLIDGGFAEVRPEGDALPSQAVPGFTLDLQRVRAAFKPW
ncbi:MAG: Uma2 family endonuclease [Planctomycetes bacterium]|nr:Uma2 family endonuclease [Planctomycetota bacterium]